MCVMHIRTKTVHHGLQSKQLTSTEYTMQYRQIKDALQDVKETREAYIARKMGQRKAETEEALVGRGDYEKNGGEERMKDLKISDRELKHLKLSGMAAAEGIVLLENDGLLPLAPGTELALYGGGVKFPVIGGSGSGSVNYHFYVNIEEGLRNAGYVIASERWLSDYEERYAAERARWQEEIFRAAGEPGDFSRLYRSFATHPFVMPEGLPVTRESETCRTALYVVTRTSGEGADRKAIPGDYYLSEQEEREIREVAAAYEKVILVLNVGGIIDLSIVDEVSFTAVVLLSQAGMDTGDALAAVLSGSIPAGGHLTDTWAYRYEDYPSSRDFSHNNGNIIEEFYTDGIYVGYRYFDSFHVKPRYPFGYGLTYTDFSYVVKNVCLEGEQVLVAAAVTNTGSRPGKEVLQLYAACPGGEKGRELKRLVAFAKTDLLQPGESADLTLQFSLEALGLYHTATATWRLAAGDTYLLLGEHAAAVEPVAVLALAEDQVISRLKNICPLADALKEIRPDEKTRENDRAALAADAADRNVPVIDLREAAERMAASAAAEDAAGCGKAQPVQADGENGSLGETDRFVEELLGKLSLAEKAAVVCGQPSAGSNQVIGNAAIHVPGAAGETASFLGQYGLDPQILADGPAGLRLQKHYQTNPADGSVYTMTRYESLVNRFFQTEFLHEEGESHYQFCTAIPIGTLLAQTWDPKLLFEAGQMIGREMEEFGVHLWLAPGMNIHRNPLCGRNYEYYSEDPLISGKMAAAITNGAQSIPGCGTTIKHFACNNQEENRMGMTSNVSERALRELYLKGFEIAVKEAQPKALMTSYNKINGIHTANSYDLCTEVLRNEWGFEGIVMTDWMTTNNGGGSSAAKCIAAGNDLIMPGNRSDIEEIIDAVRCRYDLSLPEEALDACVRRMLKLICENRHVHRGLPDRRQDSLKLPT